MNFQFTHPTYLLALIPAGLTYVEAAPSTEGSHYALSLIRKAKIQRGQDVLVNGATGAIGSAAVQLLKRLGATVTAVCATDHPQLVKDLGADRVVDYLTEDFTKDEQSYHVVLDAVGMSSFVRCKRLLKPGGIYLSTDLGPLSQNPTSVSVGRDRRGVQVHGDRSEDRQCRDQRRAFELVNVILGASGRWRSGAGTAGSRRRRGQGRVRRCGR